MITTLIISVNITWANWIIQNNKITIIIILIVSLKITVVIDDMKTAKKI